MTFHRAVKYAIAVGPVAGVAINAFQSNGGGVKGASAAVGVLTSAYTGYDVTNNSFEPSNLTLGYVPLLGAWVWGKVAGRVLR